MRRRSPGHDLAVGKAAILLYHRVASLPSDRWRMAVSPERFAEQLDAVAARFTPLPLGELVQSLQTKDIPDGAVAITFDDGYRDVLGKASPVLRRLHMPATAYVITDRISGGDPSFLTWGMLRALERRGIAIGSHTVHHLELPRLSDADALRELRDSRAELEQRLGHPVQWFAYPAGAHDTRTVALVHEAGYVLAVTTNAGSLQDARQPLELHRYEVLDTTGVAGLAALLG
jgi:peptidoglycan/xylan/chitin deacetylase (PgdA/CDA1 family)